MGREVVVGSGVALWSRKTRECWWIYWAREECCGGRYGTLLSGVRLGGAAVCGLGL